MSGFYPQGATGMDYEDGGMMGYDDEDAQEELMAVMGGRGGGQLTQQATAELYAKKLLHREFYNDFTDDCDEEDLD